MPIPAILLIIDDAVSIFLLTLLGISFHQMGAIAWERLPYTFIPFYVCWLIAASALQMYQTEVSGQWKQLWRVPAAAAIAALPAAALRSLWLGTPLAPIFVLVMGAALALVLLVSRSIYIFAFGSRYRQHG